MSSGLRVPPLEYRGRDLIVRAFWSLSVFVLLGYALFGKGFAYVGVSVPRSSLKIFIGEILLASGLVLLWLRPRLVVYLIPRRQFGYTAYLLYLLCVWGLICTLPYFERYGTDALRDAVIWGYSFFAIVSFATIVSEPWLLKWIVAKFDGFSGLFPYVISGILILGLVGISFPTWAESDVPIVSTKFGDIGVHLAGAAAFVVLGLSAARSPLWIFTFAIAFLIVAAGSRGAALSFTMAMGVIVMLKRGSWKRALKFFLALALLTALVVVIDVKIELRHMGRTVSSSQLMANYLSVVADSEDLPGGLAGTKQWRLDWWLYIIDYTLRGDYFWRGKGFGINLAYDDGILWLGDVRLRSPHNGHLTMLARAGVPGFLLWLSFHSRWAWLIFRSYRHSEKAGRKLWSAFFLFLLSYWTAFMVNTSFDVFLEGPMGGIWFWNLVGVGMAAAYLYKKNWRVLADVPTALVSSEEKLTGRRPKRSEAQTASSAQLHRKTDPKFLKGATPYTRPR